MAIRSLGRRAYLMAFAFGLTISGSGCNTPAGQKLAEHVLGIVIKVGIEKGVEVFVAYVTKEFQGSQRTESYVLTASEAQQLQSYGRTDTVGGQPQFLASNNVTVTYGIYYPTVTELVLGMPAESAGIQIGDQIYKIEDQPTYTTSSTDSDKMRSLLAKNRDKLVRLQIWRSGKSIDITVTTTNKGLIGVQYEMKPKSS